VIQHQESEKFREFSADLGGEFRRIRREQRLSLEALAERAGLHRNTISSLERGQSDISLVSNARLMAALSCISFRVGDTSFAYEAAEPGGSPECRSLLRLSGSAIVFMTGRTIHEERIRLGVTLEELAEQAGIHRNTLWNIEKGLVNPSLFCLFQIHRHLNITRMAGTSSGLRILESGGRFLPGRT